MTYEIDKGGSSTLRKLSLAELDVTPPSPGVLRKEGSINRSKNFFFLSPYRRRGEIQIALFRNFAGRGTQMLSSINQATR